MKDLYVSLLYLTFVSVLLAEYLKWLPESAHTEVSLIWPPCDRSNHDN